MMSLLNKYYHWYLIFLGSIPVVVAMVLKNSFHGSWLLLVAVCFLLMMAGMGIACRKE